MADTQRRYFSGLARGLGPDTIGAPVDAAEQFINLLIAGGGYAAHKAGLVKTPPELLRESPGTSDWWARKLGTPDDGSAAYTAGRLTPLAVGLAKPAAQGVKKALDVGLAGPKAGGRAAQRGGLKAALNQQELRAQLENLTGYKSLEALESADAGVYFRNQMRAAGNLPGEPEQGLMTPEVAALAERLRAAQPKTALRHLYHTTSPDRLEAIAAQGLIPGAAPRHPELSQQAVYLAATPEGAKYFSRPGDVVLRTRAKALPQGLEPDIFGGDGSFMLRGGLAPETLEILRGRRWEPLKP